MTQSKLAYVVALGVSAALPDTGDTNTFLAVVRDDVHWLVDCAGDPIQRLLQVGLDPLDVEGVVLTHFHPDHVYGLPAYALGLYLLAKERSHEWRHPIPICARPEVLRLVRKLLDLFADQGWLDTLPIEYREIPPEVGAPVAATSAFTITAAPGCHSVPSLALRFEIPDAPRAFVYSSDTGPCDAVAALAQGADLLIHEATGAFDGHATAAEAAEIAVEAGVAGLGLIHYESANDPLVIEAAKVFGGPIELVKPLTRYRW